MSTLKENQTIRSMVILKRKKNFKKKKKKKKRNKTKGVGQEIDWVKIKANVNTTKIFFNTITKTNCYQSEVELLNKIIVRVQT